MSRINALTEEAIAAILRRINVLTEGSTHPGDQPALADAIHTLTIAASGLMSRLDPDDEQADNSQDQAY